MKIALSGKIGCGKSHLAKVFQGANGGEKLSLADPVRDMFDQHNMELHFGAYGNFKREYCQTLGHELREWNSDVWVEMLLNRLPDNDNATVIVDDVRYPNEIAALEEKGFKVIRVVNREVDRLKNVAARDRNNYTETSAEHLVHPGELALDDYDFTYVFYNYYDDASEESFLQFVKAVWRGD